MSAAPGERGLGPQELAGLLSVLERGTRVSCVGPLVVVLDDPLRVSWADEAAARLLGTSDLQAIFDLLFAARGRGSLHDGLRRLAVGAPSRLERLRLVRGFRSRDLTVSVGRAARPDGGELFVIMFPQDEAGEQGFFVAQSQPAGPFDEAAAVCPAGPLHSPEGSPPAEAGAALPLSARIDPAPARRFLWQTDAAHRLVALSDGRPDLRGLAGGGLLGQIFPDRLAALGADPNGALAAAFETRATWGRLTLLWPVVGGTDAASVVLGAVPIIGADRMFAGYRGFGLLDPRETPTGDDPDVAVVSPTDTTEQGGEPPTDAGEPAEEPPAQVIPAAGAAVIVAPLEPSPTAEPSPDSKVESYSSKVVALRPHQPALGYHQAALFGGARDARRGEPLPEDGRDAEGGANLSSIERSAFQEIARALGARLADEPAPEAVARVEMPSAAAPPGPEAAPVDAASGPIVPAEINAEAILDALPVAIVIVQERQPVYANPASLELTGYVSLAALGASGEIGHLLGAMDAARMLEPGVLRPLTMVRGDSKGMVCEIRTVPTSWMGSAASVLTLTASPVAPPAVQDPGSDKGRGEADASESRDIIEIVSDAAAILDENGQILSLNSAAERLFGCTREAVTGDPFTLLLDQDSHAAAVNFLIARQIGDQDGTASIDVTRRSTKGRKLSLRMTARPIGSARICAMWQETSSSGGKPRDLAKASDELDEAKAVRSDFLAKVSHEIRTPLNAILGFAEVILDERFGPIGNQRYRDYLRDIHDAGTRVMTLVTDLLDLSKMEAGQVEMSVVPVDANRIVSECVRQMQPSAHRERVIMRMSLMPRLPNALVDEGALRQVVMSILSNAVKFNEPGGQVIVSTAVNESGAVAVRVRDTGVGMSEAEIALAVEPFRQINTGKPGSGNGLGLPLARALVEANQASLTIKSQRNEGTLVEIALKALEAEPIRVPAE